MDWKTVEYPVLFPNVSKARQVEVLFLHITHNCLDDFCTENIFVRGKQRIPNTSEERVEKKIFELQLVELVIALKKSSTNIHSSLFLHSSYKQLAY